MKRITRITVGTLATAALLTAGSGVALAAHQTGSTAITTTAAADTTAADISARKAVQIAKKRVPGARVTKVEREWEHGQRAWKIELRKGAWEYDVYVSARTGKIIKLKREYDD
ncbi:PepSY domain-containing protein [Streptosporangium amethystogenes subsp. fukuiense]|uniref:PepSY domain-containing protein n=1 Tax=Streptosporangium amethystogenes subsp. fukuiense TaxID=698418 RepID=A0ABW2T1B4_9ACTN